jgi:putative Ca2+/H+ antiporter (TMEM165/GDT1 family)
MRRRTVRRLGETIGPCARPVGWRTSPMRLARPPAMEAFILSTLAVVLAEIGDKTQLLALTLAARYHRPWPIVAGILVATLANHTLAAALGGWVRTALPPEVLKWLVAISFFAVAAWTLIPDKLEAGEARPNTSHLGIFGITLVAFFLAEMGDKTQVATAVLGARFGALVPVVGGTTLGMLIADVPAVFVGHLAADRLPVRIVHVLSALLFVALGLGILLYE